MKPQNRGILVGLGAVLAALTMCAVLPAIDPRCGSVWAGAAMLGTCGVAEGGLFRDTMLFGLLLATVISAVVTVLIAFEAVAHHRLSQLLRRTSLPTVIGDQAIGLVPGVSAAVVAGLRQPRIYCSEDLLRRLGEDELAGVLLHERHHAQTHAPAKLVVLAALARLVGGTSAGAAWIESERSRIEIAADDHAIANGTPRPALARAILKMAQASPTLTLAGFASATDTRIRALLGEAPTAPRSSRRLVPLTILGAVAFVTACAILPIV